MSTTTTISQSALLIDCQSSMRYHQARARFFNTAHLSIQFAVFAIASASMSRLITTWFGDQELLLVWAVVGLLALFSFVYNPAEKYSLHKSLHRSFAMLAGAIASTPNADEATLAEWTKNIHVIFADEPPVYRALLAHCDNQVSIALSVVKDGYFVDLRWYHRMLRNFVPFQGADFPNRNDV